ncbi:MAG: rhodanese-like domain-containing protein [Hyphomicrobiaceae bacterium]|nr:rhodanese-like domain-containing protein [Hyphomicrobiaceae bacterium]
MTQIITRGIKALIGEAKSQIKEYTTAEVRELAKQDDVVLVDIRDPRELSRDGVIAGAFHCPRGMLEFWIDPESPYHKPIFAEDKQFIFFCAGGMRSALTAKAAQDMGLKPVSHMIGGFGAWKKDGFEVDAYDKVWPDKK